MATRRVCGQDTPREVVEVEGQLPDAPQARDIIAKELGVGPRWVRAWENPPTEPGQATAEDPERLVEALEDADDRVALCDVLQDVFGVHRLLERKEGVGSGPGQVWAQRRRGRVPEEQRRVRRARRGVRAPRAGPLVVELLEAHVPRVRLGDTPLGVAVVVAEERPVWKSTVTRSYPKILQGLNSGDPFAQTATGFAPGGAARAPRP